MVVGCDGGVEAWSQCCRRCRVDGEVRMVDWRIDCDVEAMDEVSGEKKEVENEVELM